MAKELQGDFYNGNRDVGNRMFDLKNLKRSMRYKEVIPSP